MDTDQLVAGRYRLGRQLGSGGMGTVWQATDEQLGREVAVKQVQVPAGLTEDERRTVAERARREARAAARISSPSVVTVLDVVDDGEMPWIVMELLDGRTLSTVVADEGPLAVPEAARVGLALLDALEAAHAAGVLHRDVKPSNVMVDDRGGVVLMDFGVARLDGDATLTSSGGVIGSPAYLAPERARGEAATPASDLWSLGATLYTAVEGRPPFQRENSLATLAAVISDAPTPARATGALRPVLDALLVKNPARRPGPDEVREGFRAALAATPAAGTAAPVPSAVPSPAPAAPPPVDVEALDAAERTTVVRLPQPPPPSASPPAGPAASRRRRRAGVLAAAVAGALALVMGLIAVREGGLADAGTGGAGSTAGAAASAGGDPAQGAGEGAGGEADGTADGAEPTSPGDDGSPSESGDASGEGSGDGTETRSAGPATPRPGTRSTSGTTASPTASPAAPAVSPPAPSPTGGAAAGGAAAAVPQGYRLYTDPAGWSVAVPEGWREVRDDPRVDFRGPDGAFLRVDSTDTPAGDPYDDWIAQEPFVARRLAGYERVSIDRVEYRGWPAADWRFTWSGPNSRLRVLNRNFVVSAGEAHALYYSAPEGVYDERVHEVASATFIPWTR